MSDLGSIPERGYETAMYPSRFEIVQKQLEMAKYLQMENPSYRERIPGSIAPSLPEKYLSAKLENMYDDFDSDHSYHSLEQYRCNDVPAI